MRQELDEMKIEHRREVRRRRRQFRVGCLLLTFAGPLIVGSTLVLVRRELKRHPTTTALKAAAEQLVKTAAANGVTLVLSIGTTIAARSRAAGTAIGTALSAQLKKMSSLDAPLLKSHVSKPW